MSLIGEAIALIGDAERAARVYELLLPYEGLTIVVARAAACNGPVDRVLGLLAQTLGRLDDAERHLGNAVEIATRMGDRPGDGALRPGSRGAAARARTGPTIASAPWSCSPTVLGTAREMGARWIADRALRDRLEAQGLSGVDVDDLDRRHGLGARGGAPGHARPLPPPTARSRSCSATSRTRRCSPSGSATSAGSSVLREHNAIFREQLSRHDGYEVKSQGDGFMLAFPDPCEALECAIDVQRAFAERERRRAASRSASGWACTPAR